MKGDVVFQIAVSIAASLCAGISFFIWLSLIAQGDLTRLPLLRKRPIVLAQAVLGVLILTGSLASLALAVLRPVFRGDSLRPVLAFEVEFLLLLPTINEFLTLINQRFWGINIFITFPIIKAFLLATFFWDGISPRVRPILLLLILAFTTCEIFFIGAQYFRLLIICDRSSRLSSEESTRLGSESQTFQHRYALKAAISAATVLGSISLAITIVAGIIQPLGTQLATVRAPLRFKAIANVGQLEVAILSLMKLVLPYYLS